MTVLFARARKILVEPSDTIICATEIGGNFTINISIVNVTDLAVWECKLYFANSFLTCMEATEGAFLQSGGNTYFISNITNTFNATHGRILVGCTLTGTVPGVDGSGILVTIRFKGDGGGSTPLHLVDTKLWDSSLPSPLPISHTATDGDLLVTIAGDADHDGKVGYRDLGALAFAYGSQPGDPTWNPMCDFNCDDSIGYRDLGLLAANYGQHW
jgi:hypothetical protein